MRDADLHGRPHLDDVSRGIDAETIRQPVGVCAAIMPFNFPAMVPLWMLPFAIACGNAFILKPSEQCRSPEIAFELLDQLGLPPGVLNLVHGGREVVEGISPTPGSTRLVRRLGAGGQDRLRAVGEAGKRVQALGGAKNHMVVMPDAVMTRPSTGIGSAFGAAGQRCLAGSVLLRSWVRAARHDPAARHRSGQRAYQAWLRAGRRRPRWAQGHPAGFPRSDPCIRSPRASEQGGKMLRDGRYPAVPAKGYFVGPTF